MGALDLPLRPTPTDGYRTDTSEEQAETERNISALFDPESPVANPKLHRNEHIMWLVRFLFNGFPEYYMSQDSSQPWLMYWTLQGLMALGAALDEGSQKRAIAAIMRFQHPDGGFAGGPGQMAHILPTYAAVSALAIAGHAGPGGGWDDIDRAKMYSFFMSLKQADGSFIVNRNGEVDVRGCYCMLVCATLLDILTPELIAGTGDFVASCQTYEGGFASASFPLFTSSRTTFPRPRAALGEAHGGYTYCALASLFLLRPFSGPLAAQALHGIDVPRLIRWMASMQGTGADGGGFRGRTNKLVDGCYSWWVGGLGPLLAQLVNEQATESGDEWEDCEDPLFDKEALQHYVLVIAQTVKGGLRDKPGKNPDAYHTSYNLGGLATAQHRVAPAPEVRVKVEAAWKETPAFGLTLSGETAEDALRRRKETYLASYEWTEDEGTSVYVGGEDTRVNAAHPLYNLLITSTRTMLAHFYGQEVIKVEVVTS